MFHKIQEGRTTEEEEYRWRAKPKRAPCAGSHMSKCAEGVETGRWFRSVQRSRCTTTSRTATTTAGADGAPKAIPSTKPNAEQSEESGCEKVTQQFPTANPTPLTTGAAAAPSASPQLAKVAGELAAFRQEESYGSSMIISACRCGYIIRIAPGVSAEEAARHATLSCCTCGGLQCIRCAVGRIHTECVPCPDCPPREVVNFD